MPAEKVFTNGGQEVEAHAKQACKEGPPKEHPVKQVEAEGHLKVEGDIFKEHPSSWIATAASRNTISNASTTPQSSFSYRHYQTKSAKATRVLIGLLAPNQLSW